MKPTDIVKSSICFTCPLYLESVKSRPRQSYEMTTSEYEVIEVDEKGERIDGKVQKETDSD